MQGNSIIDLKEEPLKHTCNIEVNKKPLNIRDLEKEE